MIAFDTDMLTEVLLGNAAYVARAAAVPLHEQAVPIIVVEEIMRGRLNIIRQAEAGRTTISLARAYELFGDQVAEVFRAPFVLGTPQVLYSIFAEAGLPNAEITSQEGTACYPSIHAWIEAEVRGWTLGDVIDDEQVERLLTEAEAVFRPFVTGEGTVAFSMPALIVTATKA